MSEALSLENYGIDGDDGKPTNGIADFLKCFYGKPAKDAEKEFHSIVQDISDILESYERERSTRY